MKSKTGFFGSWTIFLLVFLGLTVALNVLVRRYDQRIDMTEAGLYTVSEETRQILANLEDRLTITYYVSEELPEQLHNLPRDTRDILREYERLSDGKLRYEVRDPDQIIDDYVASKTGEDKDDEAEDDVAAFNPFAQGSKGPRKEKEAEFQRMGVQKLQGQSFENDTFKMMTFYSAIVIKYLDKPEESIEAHQTLAGFEYELANRILKLTTKTTPKIAFFLGKPDDVRMQQAQIPQLPPTAVHPYQPLLGFFGDGFDIVDVKLTEESQIPDDTLILIVAEPHELADRQLYEIDRYIVQGGTAMFWMSNNSSDPSTGQWRITPLHHRLDTLLDAWGVEMPTDMLFSALCGPVKQRVDVGGGMQYERLDRWPACTAAAGSDINQDSVLTAGLQAMVFPFASPLEYNMSRLTDLGLDLKVLATSSDRSWMHPWGPQLTREMLMPPKNNRTQEPVYQGSFDLAYLIEGTFPSTYKAGEPLPPWPAAEGEGDGASLDEEKSSDEGTTADGAPVVIPALKAAPGRVVICASADMAKVEYLSISEEYQGNTMFFRNVIESYALGHGLDRIRRKTQTARPIEKLERSEKYMLTYGNVFGIPLLVIILGILRYLVRRGTAHRYEDRYLRAQSGGDQ